MPIKRVLVTGATGFVGSRLTELMILTGLFEPRALIRSTGAAARIARHPLGYALGDLCDPAAIDRAVAGCDAVVHLALGSEAAMTDGLRNVLRSATGRGVSRFILMSSAAIYGNEPPPESRTEAARPRPGNSYQRAKVEQERIAEAHARRHGLPLTILRPTIVYGPHSHLLTQYLARIRAGTMAILGDGGHPCNLVYVDNLCEAVFLALLRPEAAGQAFFVTDRDAVTWGRFLTDLADLAGRRLPHVDPAELVASTPPRPLRDSLRELPRALASPEFRGALRRVPLLRAAEEFAYRRLGRLRPETRQAVRERIGGVRRVPEAGPRPVRYEARDHLMAMQRGEVAHSCDKAARMLGYSAPVAYGQAMDLTAGWLRFAHLL